MKKLIVPALLAICLFLFMAGCGDSDTKSAGETDSVTSIRLRYNNEAIANNTLIKSLSEGTITFTADVQVTGSASKDFTLTSGNQAVATVSDKTVTLISEGRTVITAIAAGDTTKRHAITLEIKDENEYEITITGGTASSAKAFSGDIVTLTPGTETGKIFSDWTMNPSTITMTSPNQFRMPSSDVSITGNFVTAGTGDVPYHITNMFAQDSSTAFSVQWQNAVSVTAQTLQIVRAAGSFDDADEIQITGELFDITGITSCPSTNGTCSGAACTGLGNYEARNIFRADVTALTPNTLYKYRVGADGSWSKTYTHLTSSGNNTNFSFTVVTDSQDNIFSGMRNTLQAANTFDPDHRFFLHAGDVVDFIGLNPAEIVNYTNVASEFNIARPIATTQGNHDTYHNKSGDQYVFGEATVFNAFTVFPENGFIQRTTPAAKNRSNSYYFYYNRVLFIVINTMATGNATGTAEPNHTAQAAWFRQVLQHDKDNNLSKFRIVVTHVPPFAGRGSSGTGEPWLVKGVRDAFSPICTEFNVDIFFAGHDHVYMRSNPIKITGATTLTQVQTQNPGADGVFGPTSGGTIYSIVGSTGPKYYSFRNWNDPVGFPTNIFIPLSYPVHIDMVGYQPGSYVNVKVEGNRLIVVAKRTGFDVELDRYEVTAK